MIKICPLGISVENSLFSETRNQAANPLKASQAYKNIFDSLQNAEITARQTNEIANDVFEMVNFQNTYFKYLIFFIDFILNIFFIYKIIYF